MSADQNQSNTTLTTDGRARRRFLGASALAAGASAAGLLPGLGQAAVQPVAGSDQCPAVPTPLKDVAGKVAFITGGDSGIGLGIAKACRDAGMKVVITYRSKSHLDDALQVLGNDPANVHAIMLDVTDRPGFEKAAAETLATFGKIHLLVNNAGVGVLGGVGTASYEDWDWAIGVNATGVFNGIRNFLPHIKSQGEGGQIVNVSSLAGLLGHGPAGAYTASKFAVVGLSEALRFELASSNIGVTVFCPGIINTNIGDSARNRPGAAPPQQMDAATQARMKAAQTMMTGKAPGLDPYDTGRRVLQAVRNNDLYVLTTPEFEPEFKARGEAILASVPTDIKPEAARTNFGRMILGKTSYAEERDHRLCERAKSAKT